MNAGKAAILVLVALVAAGLFAAAPAAEQGGQPGQGPVWVIALADTVNPGSADYLQRSLISAQADDAALIVVMLDTPGGLVTSMREMVRAILACPVPVAVYVAPAGARATSAGAFLVLAGHVTAMASATHLGAASPVSGTGQDIEGTMAKKAVSDLSALAASLAKKRGIDPKLATEMVTDARSFDSAEALKLKLVDLTAADLNDLLVKLEGKTVETGAGKRVIATVGRRLHFSGPTWRDHLLSLLASPNLAYILMMIGLAGLYFELSHPGAVLPGVVGAASLILAFFAMSTLPVSYAGLALILLALVLFIAEIKVVSYGMLSVSGVICLVLGSVMLFDNDEQLVRISISVMAPVLTAVAAFFVCLAYLAGKAQLRKSVTGSEGLVGLYGEVADNGWVRVQGELWKAPGSEAFELGTRIVVRGMEGMELDVEPAAKQKEK